MICYEFWRAWLFFADGVATLVFLGKWIWVLPKDKQKLSVGEFDECKMSYFSPLMFSLLYLFDAQMYSLFLCFDLDTNGGIKCKTKLIGRFWTVSTLLCNLGITLLSELRLRWFNMLWNAKKKLYNFHVLRFERY